MILKKPKFWNYKEPNIYAFILYPITLLIKLLYYLKSKKSKTKTKIKTICVGNFYIGGTGKTSLSIKLNKILNNKKIKTCFIKKFYKDQFDEQKILSNHGKLFISSRRLHAINQAEKENYDIAILDDGLQDKSIKYDVSFVCFNNINWIGNGMTIPSGPLRESLDNLINYKHIFLNGNLENLEKINYEIFKINPKIVIHIGKYEPINLEEFNSENNYLVFSGIGNHQSFISMIKEYNLKILKDLEFPDHYQYTNDDINKIVIMAKNLNCKIITTEKDYMRMKHVHNNEIKFIKSELRVMDEEKLLKSIL